MHPSLQADSISEQGQAPSVSVWKLGKTFGALKALDDISCEFASGSFHAILGENGAGKSTLVKCIMGFYQPTSGSVLIDGREAEVRSPRVAHDAGLGMVYQHFTLVPSMTVAENLVLGLDPIPATINWKEQRERIATFMQGTPFDIDPGRTVASLAAGEKQKLEIIKQLYHGRRFIILDEPTSVLTPEEADQILGMLRDLTDKGMLSVILITHKLREVERYARDVSVLRGGRLVGGGKAADFSREALSDLMVGKDRVAAPLPREKTASDGVRLSVRDLHVMGDRGVLALRGLDLDVRDGEILGIAGVSGNGQRELVETLAGQRLSESGTITVAGEAFRPSRDFIRRHKLALMSEEPLANSVVRSMSVADNLSLRAFDRRELTGAGGWLLQRSALRRLGETLIREYGIRTQSPDARIDTLSGGNIQRCVLGRELSGEVALLVAQNPCLGLDLSAVSDIRNRILALRNQGAAVLLISEDLDEILQLSDRIAVMLDGTISHEVSRESADIATIGHYMTSDEPFAPHSGRTASA